MKQDDRYINLNKPLMFADGTIQYTACQSTQTEGVTTEGQNLVLNSQKSVIVNAKNIQVNTKTENSAGLSSGEYLPIIINGVYYKIQLLKA